MVSIFWMSFPTVALFFWEVRGHSKLYENISKDSHMGKKTAALNPKSQAFLLPTDGLKE